MCRERISNLLYSISYSLDVLSLLENFALVAKLPIGLNETIEEVLDAATSDADLENSGFILVFPG